MIVGRSLKRVARATGGFTEKRKIGVSGKMERKREGLNNLGKELWRKGHIMKVGVRVSRERCR